MLQPSRFRLLPFLGALVCCLLGVSPSFATEEPPGARELIKDATYQFRAERFERAVELARQALEAAEGAEERQDALNLLGIALHGRANGDPELLAEAEAALREALAVREAPNLTTAYNLAVVLRDAGKAVEALGYARETYRAAEGTQLADKARILVCQVKRTLPEAEPAEEPRNVRLPTETEPLGKDEVEPPRRFYDPHPENLDRARGLMIVQATVDKEGCVVDTKSLLSHLPERTTQGALATLGTWVFYPARLRGEPVAVTYNLTINFTVDYGKRKDKKTRRGEEP